MSPGGAATTTAAGLDLPSPPDRSVASADRIDLDLAHRSFERRPDQIDGQQTVAQIGAENLDAFGQYEGALELAGGDAAVQVLPRLVVDLAATDEQLVFLDGNVELVAGEAGDGESDVMTSPLGSSRSMRSML